jgi:2-oxoacid:acceptor oxidoreductase gamma subunit (pyruvate/2-ketoisovalerate family)
MIEIRFHGRGGQGAVVASKALAVAFFKEGKYVQAFPAFGAERRGAPVAAFTRVDDTSIQLRNYIYQPDHVIVLDPTLIENVDVTDGIKAEGIVIINSDRDPEEFRQLGSFFLATVDANRIAVYHKLGTPTAPIVNTAILGAYARATAMVGIEAVTEAIKESVPSNQDANASAAQVAFHKTKVAGKERAKS